jgi:small subunit ribosomal protein S6
MAKKEEMELKNYEMMVVLKPLLPDDVRKEVHKNFVDLLKELKGEVVDVDVWGKRYLAYDIKGHNEGYYIVYNFKAPTSSILELRRKIELVQEILRYMIIEAEHPENIGNKIKKKEMNLDV